MFSIFDIDPKYRHMFTGAHSLNRNPIDRIAFMDRRGQLLLFSSVILILATLGAVL